MSNRGKLIIIPPEENLYHKMFFRQISSDSDCLNALVEFYSTSSYLFRMDIANIIDEFSSVARLGNMVLKTSDDLSSICIFLPMAVSNSQYNYLYSYALELQKYKNIEAYYLKQDREMIDIGKTDDINKLILIANKKNSLYDEKGMGR